MVNFLSLSKKKSTYSALTPGFVKMKFVFFRSYTLQTQYLLYHALFTHLCFSVLSTPHITTLLLSLELFKNKIRVLSTSSECTLESNHSGHL